MLKTTVLSFANSLDLRFFPNIKKALPDYSSGKAFYGVGNRSALHRLFWMAGIVRTSDTWQSKTYLPSSPQTLLFCYPNSGFH
jgi:hypothetical protein